MQKQRTHVLATVLLALAICGGLLIGEALRSRPATYAQDSGPRLSIPADVAAGSPGTVTVPVHFARNQSGVAALTFALDYDPACLLLAVPPGGQAADAVTFRLPPQLSGSVLYDPADADAELDIAIADYAPPFSTLPDSEPLVEVTFNVVCSPPEGETIVSPVRFSQAPSASFSNTLARSLAGSTVDGAVVIQHGPLPPTPEPSETPDPDETPEPVNTAPLALDDTAATREFRPVNIPVLANDTDADDDPLTVIEVTQGGFGQVVVLPDGRVQYTPQPGRNGADLFSYTVSDGRGGLATALVRVTVSEFNIPPVAEDDAATTLRNREVVIDVLANDYDSDAAPGATLTVAVLGQPLHGAATLNADGTVTFAPKPGYVGSDEFWYSVLDGEGGSDIAKVTIIVQPFNRPPEVDLPTEALEYEPGRVATLQIVATDPDGDANLTYTATGLPPGLTMDPATGKISGTISPTATGDYPVTVVVSDGLESTGIQFTLTVTPPAAMESVLFLPQTAR